MRLFGCSTLVAIVELLKQKQKLRHDRSNQIQFFRCRIVDFKSMDANSQDLMFVAHSYWHPLSCGIGLPVPVLAMLLQQRFQFR
jgi:hypothetical protein